MGIAGFFLWLKQWYGECIDIVPQEVVDAALRNETVPPGGGGGDARYDNFYIDMNGLIHPCCHDTDPLPEPESVAEMIERIFAQIDLLVKVVQPRQCLVLCVDGVAPRSKMNQQRSRRFRAADERVESDTISAQCAQRLETEYHLPRPRVRERWDSNVITPSTEFMERIGLALEWFVLKKLNEDAAWRHLSVVFSDAHVAGEGEHKIMHYIRGLRSQPGYNPHTRHVIHGMDADLVCLGLSTHEAYVSILRNQLTETFQPDHNKFCYFNLHTYRACLQRDFANIPDMDFERVLDDFVFLCFFVGNDFLPHVPLISIKTKGIELLLDHYVRQFATHHYLTVSGEVDYTRLHTFLHHFVKARMPDLRKEYHGVLRAKERAKMQVAERVGKMEHALQTTLESVRSGDGVKAQCVSDEALHTMTSCVKERTRLVADRQPLPFSYLDEDYRDAYYVHKFGWTCTAQKRSRFEKQVRLCCAEYLRGMQWVMRYYTKGCPSWSWYYPYYYAPLLQDLASFTGVVNVHMTLGAPLHPVEQLLAVLPRLSVHALPPELHKAVVDPASVLGVFYPDTVDVDFSEANFSYQGVLRIPFVDCASLQKACHTLVDLDPDVGTTRLFCHEKSRACKSLERLLGASGGAPAVSSSGSLASQDGQRGEGGLPTCFAGTPITADVARLTPIAGMVSRYEEAWPMHVALDCPDAEMASRSALATRIARNAVRVYRYELHTETDYRAELLSGKPQARPRRSKKENCATATAATQPVVSPGISARASSSSSSRAESSTNRGGVCARKGRRLAKKSRTTLPGRSATKATRSAVTNAKSLLKMTSGMASRNGNAKSRRSMKAKL